MRRRLLPWSGALLAWLFFTGCFRPGAIDTQSEPATLAEFERRLDDLRRRLNIPGLSAAIAQDGGVIWARGFGEADRESGAAVDTASVFHLASLTKPFAATVLLQLAEERRLDLDAPISTFGVRLEDDYGPSDTVRVRHLLSHTSGSPPGTAYRYDGQMYGRLTDVVEAVTGREFAATVADRIIRPLGLRYTAPDPRDSVALAASGLDGTAIRERMVTNYARTWGRSLYPPGLFGPMRPMDEPTGFNAATGLVASAPDVARFAAALDEGHILADSTLEVASQPAVTPSGERLPYGSGWFIQEVEGQTVLWHHGHWYSDSALIVRVPERRLTLVVLANSDGLSRWRSLGDHGDVLRSPVAVAFLNTAMVRAKHTAAGSTRSAGSRPDRPMLHARIDTPQSEARLRLR